MLSVVCALFDGGTNVPTFSRCFGPEWVDRLARGVKRNLTVPHRFVCLTHYPASAFQERVQIVSFLEDTRSWACLVEMWRPTVVGDRAVCMGLDTVIVGSLDDIASYSGPLAMCRDRSGRVCKWNNGVMLYDRTTAERLWAAWLQRPGNWEDSSRVVGRPSEMAFLNRTIEKQGIEPDAIEDLWPGQVITWGDLRGGEKPADARVVWFFARPKPHEVSEPWIQEAWT